MPARCGRKVDSATYRKAAALFLDDDMSVDALTERFGLTRGSLRHAVARLRRERGIAPRSKP